MPEQTVLSVTIKPDWTHIETLRLQCREFLKQCGFIIDVVEAVSMVSSELLENAVKYGIYGLDDTIEYRLNIGKGDIVVEVKNPMDHSVASHLNKLDETIQWIRGYQNPFEAYVKKLKEVSTKFLLERGSRLGLVRIAYEGQSILDFFLEQDSILSVSAIYQNQAVKEESNGNGNYLSKQ
jgi:hypothetical protein